MRNLLRNLCLWGLLGLLAACGKPVERPLQLGTVQWPGYEPLYLARSLGYFDESQVKLVEHMATTETIDAFRNDAIDLAGLTLDEVLRLKQQGKDMKIILLMDLSNGADVVIARSGIRSMKELKGKRIGVEENALGAYMLGRALEYSGMKPQDVEIVSLMVGEHETAFGEGRIDAAVTFDPFKTRLLKMGGKVVFDSSKIPDEIVDVLVADPEYLRMHRDEVMALIEAWYRSLDYLRDHREDAAQRIAGRLGISPAEFLDSLEGLRIADRESNERMLSGESPALEENLQRLSRMMQANSLLNGPVDTSGLIDASLLR